MCTGAHVSGRYVCVWQSAGRDVGNAVVMVRCRSAAAHQGRAEGPQHRCSGDTLPHVHRVALCREERAFRARAPSGLGAWAVRS